MAIEVNPVKLHATRFRHIALGNHGRAHWAFYDIAEERPAMLQPVYATKAEALADAYRQSENRGWQVCA